MAPRQELALNQALSAQFVPYLSFLIHLVHLLVIWQCPSGTEFGDNIVQFNFFSVDPVYQRTSGLRTEKFIEFQFISVSILWGRAPQNLLTKVFKFLEKNSKSKKNQIFFFRFWVKKLCRSMYFGLRSTGKHFFCPKLNFKIFRYLDLENFQKFFKKMLNFFNIFFKNLKFLVIFLQNFRSRTYY